MNLFKWFLIGGFNSLNLLYFSTPISNKIKPILKNDYDSLESDFKKLKSDFDNSFKNLL